MPGEVVSFHYPTCIFFALQQKLVQAELRLDLDVVVCFAFIAIWFL